MNQMQVLLGKPQLMQLLSPHNCYTLLYEKH